MLPLSSQVRSSPRAPGPSEATLGLWGLESCAWTLEVSPARRTTGKGGNITDAPGGEHVGSPGSGLPRWAEGSLNPQLQAARCPPHTHSEPAQWERLPGPPKGRKTRNCGSSEGLTAGVPGSCGVTGSLATSWAGSSSPHLPLLFCGHGPSSLPAQSGEGSFPEADDQRGAHNWMSPRVSASSPRTGGRRCLPKVQVSPAPLRVVGPAVAPGLGQACPFLLRQVVCMRA